MNIATSSTSSIDGISSPAMVASPRQITTGSSTEVKSETDILQQKHQRQAIFQSSTITSATHSLTDDLLGDSSRKDAFVEARRICSNRFEQSSEFGLDTSALRQIPKFAKNELALGKRLGKGKFSNVDEIRGISLHHRSLDRRNNSSSVDNKRSGPPSLAPLTFPDLPSALKKLPLRTVCFNLEDTVAQNDQESQAFMEQHCFRLSGDARYALKMVRRDVFNNADESDVTTGICDLAVETAFLSALEHPNIIKLRGIADLNHPFSSSFFFGFRSTHRDPATKNHPLEGKGKTSLQRLGTIQRSTRTKEVGLF
jgi:hypothetical protein